MALLNLMKKRREKIMVENWFKNDCETIAHEGIYTDIES